MQHIEDNTENRTEQNTEQDNTTSHTYTSTIQNTDTTIMQHIEDNTENNTGATENNAQPQRTEQHNLVHIVLIFITYNNISKNSIT